MSGSRGLAIAVALVAGGFMLHCWTLAVETIQLLSPGVLATAMLFWAYLLWRLPDTPLHRSSLCALVAGTMVGVSVQRAMLGGSLFMTAIDGMTTGVYWFCWWYGLKRLRSQAMVDGALAVMPQPPAMQPEDEYDNDPANWVTSDGGPGGSGVVVALDGDYGGMPAVYFGLDGNPIRNTRKRPKDPEPPPSVDASIPERKLDRRKP